MMLPQRPLRMRQKRSSAGTKRLSKRLVLDLLEGRIQPSPFTPTGILGVLAPHNEVAFNTGTGQYQVDHGAWLSGGM